MRSVEMDTCTLLRVLDSNNNQAVESCEIRQAFEPMTKNLDPARAKDLFEDVADMAGITPETTQRLLALHTKESTEPLCAKPLDLTPFKCIAPWFDVSTSSIKETGDHWVEMTDAKGNVIVFERDDSPLAIPYEMTYKLIPAGSKEPNEGQAPNQELAEALAYVLQKAVFAADGYKRDPNPSLGNMIYMNTPDLLSGDLPKDVPAEIPEGFELSWIKDHAGHMYANLYQCRIILENDNRVDLLYGIDTFDFKQFRKPPKVDPSIFKIRYSDSQGKEIACHPVTKTEADALLEGLRHLHQKELLRWNLSRAKQMVRGLNGLAVQKRP